MALAAQNSITGHNGRLPLQLYFEKGPQRWGVSAQMAIWRKNSIFDVVVSDRLAIGRVPLPGHAMRLLTWVLRSSLLTGETSLQLGVVIQRNVAVAIYIVAGT